MMSDNKLENIKSKLPEKDTKDLTYKHPHFLEASNNLCCFYAYNYMVTNIGQTTSFNMDTLESSLRLLPQYKRLYIYMIEMLRSEGWLATKNNQNISFTGKHTTHSHSNLIETFPEFTGTLTLLQHCISHYPEALSGHIPAIGVLYPEGKATFIEKTLQMNTAEYSEMPILKEIAAQLVCELEKKRPLKILEVGGGRGVLSKKIFQRSNNLKYHFTDISKRFVIDMEQYVISKNINFVTCDQLNINITPDSQNFTSHNYDIIIALDVVHATPNLQVSLKNLKSLLSNNGALLLLETTRAPYYQSLTMGLSSLWWNHSDSWRRLTPLVEPPAWEDALKKSGFNLVKTITLNNPGSDAAIILAA